MRTTLRTWQSLALDVSMLALLLAAPATESGESWPY
jgi:hypothetical protein